MSQQSKTPRIRVVLSIFECDIRNLILISNRDYGTRAVIDEQRLAAAMGMEVELDSIVTVNDDDDLAEYGRFLMGVTASLVNYLHICNSSPSNSSK